MSTDAAAPRSSVSVQRLKDGQHTWRLTVVADDNTSAGLRAAVALAKELDRELTTVYIAGMPAEGGIDDGRNF